MNIQFFDTQQSGDQIAMNGQEVWSAGRTWRRADLTGKTEIHLAGYVTNVGGNGGTITLEYRADGSSAWLSTGASITVGATDSEDMTGAVATLPAGATTQVWLRLVAASGATGDEVTFYALQAIAA